MNYSIGILAGGKSSRFGLDKATYTYKNKSLLGILLSDCKNLSFFPDTIFISVRNAPQFDSIKKILEKEKYLKENIDQSFYLEISEIQKKIPIEFLSDSSYPHFDAIDSPILGLNLIFNRIKSGYCVILPCDTPFFQMQTINSYIKKMDQERWEPDLLLPRWNNGFIEPLHGFYRVECFIPFIEKQLAEKQFQLKQLFQFTKRMLYWEIEKEIKNYSEAVLNFKNFNQIEDFVLMRE